MRRAQQNFNLICILLLGSLAGSAPASAGIADRGAPEPLLHDGPKGACDPGLARPDYVSGVDVNGNPVLPADLARGRNPAPDEIMVPSAKRGRHRRPAEGPVVALDGRKLDPILNPTPACPVKAR